jgi:hypothetical protein
MLVREWTKDDEKIIIEYYPKFGAKFCSEKLNRTVKAIRKRAAILNVKYERIKEIYHEDNMRCVVRNSKSIGEVLDKLNLRRAGGNYSVINNYIKKYNIDIEHFVEYGFNLNECRIVRNLDEVLVENSNYSRKNLKNRLFKEKLLLPICCLCGQNENWNGMKISLVLDHINGVYNDNRIENLRIVCPNCNAGLETFAGRNKSKNI